MKFSPSVRAVFGKSDITINEMIQKAYALGYSTIEFWKWWEEEDLDEIRSLVMSLNMNVGSVCTKFITLTDPAFRDEYLRGLQESIEAAKRLDCKFLISQTGNERPGIPREEQAQSLVEGLRATVPYLEQAGITLVVEPLNILVNHKGYYLETSREAFQIIDQVGSPNVKILYDVYHQQVTEGNLIMNITDNIDKIGYFHIADHPGRHEIGTGEINFRNVLDAIRKTGFDGYIGLEYFPIEDPEEGLKTFLANFAV